MCVMVTCLLSLPTWASPGCCHGELQRPLRFRGEIWEETEKLRDSSLPRADTHHPVTAKTLPHLLSFFLPLNLFGHLGIIQSFRNSPSDASRSFAQVRKQTTRSRNSGLKSVWVSSSKMQMERMRAVFPERKHGGHVKVIRL